ncbi:MULTISPECIES: hypothetical protein [Antarcticibacterium]|uniref:hypothetical protein n=1 Tax=Antarcticibacterium TaxID=2058174 RepID=UPI001FE46969|nr:MULTISPECIES: hypothetical protein [Antarcticibacterium]
MPDYNLQIFLPALMLVATSLVIFWKFARNAVKVTSSHSIEKMTAYDRLKRISGYYWAIFICFIFMTFIYSLAPEYYFIFFPIEKLHHPLINQTGMLILKIAVVWILIAQLQIDKELYKYSRDIESLSAMELIRYSEKRLLSGMLVLFIGLVTTITNLIGFVLVFISCLVYYKIFKTNRNLENWN